MSPLPEEEEQSFPGDFAGFHSPTDQVDFIEEDNEDDENVETVGLIKGSGRDDYVPISNRTRRGGRLGPFFDRLRRSRNPSRGCKLNIVVCLVCALLAFIVVSLMSYRRRAVSIKQHIRTQEELHLTCPTYNHEIDPEAAIYVKEDQEIEANIDAYYHNFRDKEYDEWGLPYSRIKEKFRSFKTDAFSSLKNGDRIFESACGTGLNLVMTLEILEEDHGVTDLTVFGNDYLKESVVVANQLMDKGILPAKNEKGSICQANSESLHYIPNDSFDLVFSSYITPKFDPLETGLSEDGDEIWDYYSLICSQELHDWDTLLQKWVQVQEEWYTQWVAEMVRIAKPGATIVIEQVAPPFCDFSGDWDGISQSFWQFQVQNGVWDVDPKSLDISAAAVFWDRYNVVFRKNGVHES